MTQVAAPAAAAAADRVGALLVELCDAIAGRIARDGGASPLILFLQARLRGMVGRFAAIAGRFAAGTLRPVATRAYVARPLFVIREVPTGLDAEPPPVDLPRVFGWLLRRLPGTAELGLRLQLLLETEPDLVPLLRASPQVQRMLRSVLWMTGVRLVPMALRLTARPRRPGPGLPPRAPEPLPRARAVSSGGIGFPSSGPGLAADLARAAARARAAAEAAAAAERAAAAPEPLPTPAAPAAPAACAAQTPAQGAGPGPSGLPDSGPLDAGPPDAGRADSGPPDAGRVDAGPPGQSPPARPAPLPLRETWTWHPRPEWPDTGAGFWACVHHLLGFAQAPPYPG